MQTITKYLALVVLCLNVQFINAQDTIPAIKNKANIDMLEKVKETIKNEERAYLKREVEAINLRLKKKEITQEEAEILKLEAAKIAALNIENRLGILDNKIALLTRNDYGLNRTGKNEKFGVVVNNKAYTISGENNDKSKKYKGRNKRYFSIAYGLNNAIIEGEKLEDSPYKFGGSRFFEIGMSWKTRVFEKTNFLRFKYAFSFQINGLKIKDNQYFVEQGDQTVLQVFPENLKKSKLTLSNLVFPMHFEFGPSRKIEKDTYYRYSTHNKLKIGIGGYAGFNIGTRQKLKYRIDGKRQKDKIKGGLNTTNLVYGLSSYVAIGSAALYVKYDLSPIFKNQITDQNNISLGVRFDMD